MASKPQQTVAEVVRYVILAYLAGVITGLALFGAGSFYYARLFQ